MGKIWLSSDLHFSHDKPFIYEARGFANVAAMNEAIVDRFRSTIAEDDDLYLLGDLMLGDTDVGISLLNSLPGRKFIILGNHDGPARQAQYAKYVRNLELMQYATLLKYRHYSFYLSHYPILCSNFDDDRPLKAKTISLCGHTHTQDAWSDWDKGYIYHVDVDCHECYPVALDGVIEALKEVSGHENRRGK